MIFDWKWFQISLLQTNAESLVLSGNSVFVHSFQKNTRSLILLFSRTPRDTSGELAVHVHAHKVTSDPHLSFVLFVPPPHPPPFTPVHFCSHWNKCGLGNLNLGRIIHTKKIEKVDRTGKLFVVVVLVVVFPPDDSEPSHWCDLSIRVGFSRRRSVFQPSLPDLSTQPSRLKDYK